MLQWTALWMKLFSCLDFFKSYFLVAHRRITIMSFLLSPACSGSWAKEWPNPQRPWRPSWRLSCLLSGNKLLFRRAINLGWRMRFSGYWPGERPLWVLECFTSQGIKGALWVEDSRPGEQGGSAAEILAGIALVLPGSTSQKRYLDKRMEGSTNRSTCSCLRASAPLTARAVWAHAPARSFWLLKINLL